MRNLARLSALVFTLFTLCACTTRPSKPEIDIVRVPVVVPCIETMPVKPVFEVSLLKPTDPLPVVTDAYMIDRRQRIGYEAELEGLLIGCLKK